MKYEMTGEKKHIDGVILHRIKALKDFAFVKAGDLGGWIEKESNLDQTGNAWVADEAEVFGNAKVWNNARIYDHAKVFGCASIHDNAFIGGNACINESAFISGNACVDGDSKVSNSASVRDYAHVTDHARVLGCANVCDHACLQDYAKAFGSTIIYGHANMAGDAAAFNSSWIGGDAQVFGSVNVGGNSHIFGHARINGKAIECNNVVLCKNACIREHSDFICIHGIMNPNYCLTFFRQDDNSIAFGCDFHNELTDLDPVEFEVDYHELPKRATSQGTLEEFRVSANEMLRANKDNHNEDFKFARECFILEKLARCHFAS